jgi:hypothetical protein
MSSSLHDDFVPDAHNEFSLEYLLEDNSSDEEEEAWDELIEQHILLFATYKEERNFRWEHERLNWNEHVAKLLHENAFDRKYRMSYNAFNILLELLRPDITCNIVKSMNSCNEPIFPELVLATGLRWLAGGSYLDQKDVYSYSQSSYYRIQDIFIDAVLTCDDLDICFPDFAEDLESVRVRFESKSTNLVFRGCVGAMDGLLVRIKCPTVKESNGNPRAYHSGHYNADGLNVQAICDSRLRFLFFAVAKPGGSSDLRAYESLHIRHIIESLPDGVYIVADAAYMLSEHVIVPFTGGDRFDPSKDAFNYYLSQLRIRIEMAFGLLCTKWEILQKNLKCSLVKNSKIVEACARLHNFVINNDSDDNFDEDCYNGDQLEDVLKITPMPGSPLNWGFLPSVKPLVPIPGSSRTRKVILQHVAESGYRRPSHNVERRRAELYEMDDPLM